MNLKSLLTCISLCALSMTASADAILEITYADEAPKSVGVAADYMFEERDKLGVFESLKYKDGFSGVEMHIQQAPDEKQHSSFLLVWKELSTVIEQYTFGGSELKTPRTTYATRRTNIKLDVNETVIISKDKDENATITIKRIK